MKKPLVLAALILPSIHSPLFAAGDDYQRLVDALASEERLMEDFESGAETEMQAVYEADPDMVDFERECPGVLIAMTDAMMPALSRSQRRGVREYRMDLLTLFRDRLDPADARLAADFYASETGQALIKLAEDHTSIANIREDVHSSEGMAASEEAFVADKAATQQAVKNNMEPTLRREAEMKLAASEWFMRFITLKPDMDRLELEFVNDDFTPDEDAEIDEALDAALVAKTDECYGSAE